MSALFWSRKFSKQALEKFETPEAVTELCLSFCELQARGFGSAGVLDRMLKD